MQSTKIKIKQEHPTPTIKERDIFVQVEDMETIYTDQTGKFPTCSSRGNKYIMVMSEIDSDSILVAGMKNQSEGEMFIAYQSLINRLAARCIKPKKQILDNKASKAYKKAIVTDNDITYQLVPPDLHWRNITEKSIQSSTFKDHLVAILLCGIDPSFPLHLWDHFLPQAEMTLNLLQPSNTTPTVSAYAHRNGQHDYNKMPLPPMGCAVLMHDKQQTQQT